MNVFDVIALAMLVSGQMVDSSAYPKDALKAGEQGITVISLRYGPSGRVEECHVVETSGSKSLDDASCPLASRMTSGVRPVDVTLERTLHWELPHPVVQGPLVSYSIGEAFPVRLSGALLQQALSLNRLFATATLTISERGTLIACKIMDPTGSPRLDRGICDAVRKNGSFKPGTNAQGLPKRAEVVQRIGIVVKP